MCKSNLKHKTVNPGLRVVVARTLVSAVVFDALVPLSPLIAQDLSVSPAFFQGMLGLCLMAFAFSQLFSTPLVNRLGTSVSLAGASVLIALLCVAVALSTSALMLSIIFTSMFIANAVAATSSRLWLLQRLGQTTFQSTTAYLLGTISILAVLSPPTLLAAASVWGWRWVFGVLGCLLLLICFGLLATYDGKAPEQGQLPATETQYLLWRRPKFICGLLLALLIQSAFTQLNLSKAFALQGVFHLSPQATGMALSGWAALVAAGFFFSGKAVTRFSDAQRLNAGVVSQCLAALLMVAAWLHVDIYLYLAAAAATSIAFCILLPLATGWALDIDASHQAKASAVFGCITVAGAGLLTWLGSQWTAPLLFTLMLVIGGCAVGNVFACQLARKKIAR